nr:hypothetical protein [Tanacetum cinerariifolium]
MNQEEVNELRAERLAKSHDPLALMAHSQSSYNFPTTQKDQSSSSTHSQQSFPINNKFNPQPSLNQNFMQPQMTSLEDINDPTEAINAVLILFSKGRQLTAPTNNNQRTSSNPCNRQIAQLFVNMSQDRQTQNVGGNGGNQFRQYARQVAQNQQGYNAWQNGGIQGIANQSGTGNVVTARAEGIQLQAEEYDFMAAAGDLDEIKEVNANCILMANLQHASTSGTQFDKAPVYDTDGSAEVQLNDNCYDNEIFNMFTQEEQYTDLLEPIPKPQLVLQNDNHVTSIAPSMVQSGGTVETSFALNEETRAHQETVYRNLVDQVAQLRARVFENTSESMKNASRTSVAPHVDKPKLSAVTPHSNKLQASILSHSVPQPREFNIMKHRIVIAPVMFKINPSQMPRENVSSNTVTASSIGLVHTSRTRRPPLKGNIRNARVLSTSKSSKVKKNVTVEDHRRTLLLSKNQKTMSSECNNIKLAIRNDKFGIVCDTCKQCLVTANHDACLPSSVNALNSHANNLCSNVPLSANQKRHRTQVWKPKQVESKERLSCKPRLPRLSLKWSPSGRIFDLKGKLVAFNKTNCPNDDKACTFNPHEPMRKRFPNSTVFLGRLSKFVCGTVHFGNDHIAAIVGYGDLKWGNITITRVYFIEGLGHNPFSVGQFCDADLEVAFWRNTCFIRYMDGVDLLKGNRSINLYTINLYDMASASPICLMARATPTKSWLWHQRLSHLNFDTINDLAKNDLVSSLPKFKYAKEHLCLSCEQGKSKRASHPPGFICFIWICVVQCELQALMVNAPVIIVRTDNGTESKNYVLKEYFDSVGITHETSTTKTPQKNGVVMRRNRTLVEVARTMLIFSDAPLFLWAKAIATACYTQNHSIIHRRFNKTPYELVQVRKPDISYLYVFGALCFPKNDHEDIGKLGAKSNIGFFIGYSANYVAYRVYNRRTKKIIETMNVTFDELSAMTFEQNSSRPGLHSMTSRQISSELKLTYAPSTITPQRPSERDLDILFGPLHNEYLGGQPSAVPRVISAAPVPVVQNLQAPTASMSFQDSAPVPTNSSNTPVSSHNVDGPS